MVWGAVAVRHCFDILCCAVLLEFKRALKIQLVTQAKKQPHLHLPSSLLQWKTYREVSMSAKDQPAIQKAT